MSDLVVVIPARGGSKRIKGKNIRPLAGKPLVHHAIEYALELGPKTIVVSTDSDEVAGVVRTRYPEVQIDRSFNHTDESTVDELTLSFFKTFIHKGETLVVIQPTMIGDVVQNIKNILPIIVKHGGEWRLSGLRIVSSPTVGWWENVSVRSGTTLIDIDTLADFVAAELFLRKQTAITIVYKSGEKQGWGHELRAKTLADALQDYEVWLCPLDVWLGNSLVGVPDVLILDMGDTTEDFYHRLLDSCKVITIEDNGPGARLAHASINPFTDLKYAVLRPEFYNLPEYVVRDKVQNTLVSFGGQNNHDMEDFVKDSIRVSSSTTPTHSTRIPKEGTMAASMLECDIFVCAGGQTSYEAIKVGIPTIVIPALTTEAMRPHLSPSNGIINLGVAPSSVAIKAAYERVAGDKMLRQDMSNRMKATTVGDGTVHIRRIVEDLCQR